jgi:hypothetical protein
VERGGGGRPIVRQCTAHITRGPDAGRRCRRSAVRGTNVCPMHGGRAPQVRAAAARSVATAQALAAYERYSPNGHGPVDVLAELGRLVAEVRHFADWAGGRVAALTAGDWRPDQPRAAAELALYERALDRAGRLLADVARLGLDAALLDRAVRDVWVQQRIGEQVKAAVDRALYGAGLADADRLRVVGLLPEAFRAVLGGDSGPGGP